MGVPDSSLRRDPHEAHSLGARRRGPAAVPTRANGVEDERCGELDNVANGKVAAHEEDEEEEEVRHHHRWAIGVEGDTP